MEIFNMDYFKLLKGCQYICNICNKSFVKKTDLETHYDIHKKCLKKNHFCNKCRSAFRTNADLVKHKSLRHREITPDSKSSQSTTVRRKSESVIDKLNLCNSVSNTTRSGRAIKRKSACDFKDSDEQIANEFSLKKTKVSNVILKNNHQETSSDDSFSDEKDLQIVTDSEHDLSCDKEKKELVHYLIKGSKQQDKNSENSSFNKSLKELQIADCDIASDERKTTSIETELDTGTVKMEIEQICTEDIVNYSSNEETKQQGKSSDNLLDEKDFEIVSDSVSDISFDLEKYLSKSDSNSDSDDDISSDSKSESTKTEHDSDSDDDVSSESESGSARAESDENEIKIASKTAVTNGSDNSIIQNVNSNDSFEETSKSNRLRLTEIQLLQKSSSRNNKKMINNSNVTDHGKNSNENLSSDEKELHIASDSYSDNDSLFGLKIKETKILTDVKTKIKTQPQQYTKKGMMKSTSSQKSRSKQQIKSYDDSFSDSNNDMSNKLRKKKIETESKEKNITIEPQMTRSGRKIKKAVNSYNDRKSSDSDENKIQLQQTRSGRSIKRVLKNNLDEKGSMQDSSDDDDFSSNSDSEISYKRKRVEPQSKVKKGTIHPQLTHRGKQIKKSVRNSIEKFDNSDFDDKELNIASDSDTNSDTSSQFVKEKRKIRPRRASTKIKQPQHTRSGREIKWKKLDDKFCDGESSNDDSDVFSDDNALQNKSQNQYVSNELLKNTVVGGKQKANAKKIIRYIYANAVVRLEKLPEVVYKECLKKGHILVMKQNNLSLLNQQTEQCTANTGDSVAHNVTTERSSTSVKGLTPLGKKCSAQDSQSVLPRAKEVQLLFDRIGRLTKIVQEEKKTDAQSGMIDHNEPNTISKVVSEKTKIESTGILGHSGKESIDLSTDQRAVTLFRSREKYKDEKSTEASPKKYLPCMQGTIKVPPLVNRTQRVITLFRSEPTMPSEFLLQQTSSANCDTNKKEFNKSLMISKKCSTANQDLPLLNAHSKKDKVVERCQVFSTVSEQASEGSQNNIKVTQNAAKQILKLVKVDTKEMLYGSQFSEKSQKSSENFTHTTQKWTKSINHVPVQVLPLVKIESKKEMESKNQQFSNVSEKSQKLSENFTKVTQKISNTSNQVPIKILQLVKIDSKKKVEYQNQHFSNVPEKLQKLPEKLSKVTPKCENGSSKIPTQVLIPVKIDSKKEMESKNQHFSTVSEKSPEGSQKLIQKMLDKFAEKEKKKQEKYELKKKIRQTMFSCSDKIVEQERCIENTGIEFINNVEKETINAQNLAEKCVNMKTKEVVTKENQQKEIGAVTEETEDVLIETNKAEEIKSYQVLQKSKAVCTKKMETFEEKNIEEIEIMKTEAGAENIHGRQNRNADKNLSIKQKLSMSQQKCKVFELELEKADTVLCTDNSRKKLRKTNKTTKLKYKTSQNYEGNNPTVNKTPGVATERKDKIEHMQVAMKHDLKSSNFKVNSDKKIGRKILEMDEVIKVSLNVNSLNVNLCLKAMNWLDDLHITEGIWKKCLVILKTIKKCRKFKGSEEVRKKADYLYKKFMRYFMNPAELKMKRIDKSTKDAATKECSVISAAKDNTLNTSGSATLCNISSSCKIKTNTEPTQEEKLNTMINDMNAGQTTSPINAGFRESIIPKPDIVSEKQKLNVAFSEALCENVVLEESTSTQCDKKVIAEENQEAIAADIMTENETIDNQPESHQNENSDDISKCMSIIEQFIDKRVHIIKKKMEGKVITPLTILAQKSDTENVDLIDNSLKHKSDDMKLCGEQKMESSGKTESMDLNSIHENSDCNQNSRSVTDENVMVDRHISPDLPIDQLTSDINLFDSS